VQTELLAEPTLQYLRDLSVAVQAVGVKGSPLRVYTRDGTVYDTPWLGSAFDQLFVGQRRRPPLELPLAAVTRIDRLELSLKRALGLGGMIVILGAISGMIWDLRHGDPMRWHDGLVLGVLSAALASPFVVWLVQDLRWFKQWHVIIDELNDQGHR